MKKQFLIDYLEATGCKIVRVANQGYHVMENPDKGTMSGVPKDDEINPEMVCRICKTLEVRLPKNKEVLEAEKDLDEIIMELSKQKPKKK
jgi:alpha-acetolactate decarboxylase